MGHWSQLGPGEPAEATKPGPSTAAWEAGSLQCPWAEQTNCRTSGHVTTAQFWGEGSLLFMSIRLAHAGHVAARKPVIGRALVSCLRVAEGAETGLADTFLLWACGGVSPQIGRGHPQSSQKDIRCSSLPLCVPQCAWGDGN